MTALLDANLHLLPVQRLLLPLPPDLHHFHVLPLELHPVLEDAHHAEAVPHEGLPAVLPVHDPEGHLSQEFVLLDPPRVVLGDDPQHDHLAEVVLLLRLPLPVRLLLRLGPLLLLLLGLLPPLQLVEVVVLEDLVDDDAEDVLVAVVLEGDGVLLSAVAGDAHPLHEVDDVLVDHPQGEVVQQDADVLLEDVGEGGDLLGLRLVDLLFGLLVDLLPDLDDAVEAPRPAPHAVVPDVVGGLAHEEVDEAGLFLVGVGVEGDHVLAEGVLEEHADVVVVLQVLLAAVHVQLRGRVEVLHLGLLAGVAAARVVDAEVVAVDDGGGDQDGPQEEALEAVAAGEADGHLEVLQLQLPVLDAGASHEVGLLLLPEHLADPLAGHGLLGEDVPVLEADVDLLLDGGVDGAAPVVQLHHQRVGGVGHLDLLVAEEGQLQLGLQLVELLLAALGAAEGADGEGEAELLEAGGRVVELPVALLAPLLQLGGRQVHHRPRDAVHLVEEVDAEGDLREGLVVGQVVQEEQLLRVVELLLQQRRPPLGLLDQAEALVVAEEEVVFVDEGGAELEGAPADAVGAHVVEADVEGDGDEVDGPDEHGEELALLGLQVELPEGAHHAPEQPLELVEEGPRQRDQLLPAVPQLVHEVVLVYADAQPPLRAPRVVVPDASRLPPSLEPLEHLEHVPHLLLLHLRHPLLHLPDQRVLRPLTQLRPLVLPLELLVLPPHRLVLGGLLPSPHCLVAVVLLGLHLPQLGLVLPGDEDLDDEVALPEGGPVVLAHLHPQLLRAPLLPRRGSLSLRPRLRHIITQLGTHCPINLSMQRANSYSLQKIPIRRSLQRVNSLDSRLHFPVGGDSNIFCGVGRRHFTGDEEVLKFKLPESSKLAKSTSSRNILSVADIEGASPSVAPQKVRNILRGREHSQKGSGGVEALGEYEKLFSLKQLSDVRVNKSEVLLVSSPSPPKPRLNPTFMPSLVLHHS